MFSLGRQFYRSTLYIYMFLYIIIIIIMSYRWHRFPWPSPTSRPYHPSLSAGLPCYILYQYRAVVAGRPTFVRQCEGTLRSTSLMSPPLLLWQCHPCLDRLISIVFEMGGRWPYSCCLWDATSRTCSVKLTAFLWNCRQAFFPYAKSESMWCIHIAVSIRLLLGKNCALFYLIVYDR